MKKQTILLISLLFTLSLAANACAPTQASEVAINPWQVTVSILPQAYFVERIAGDLVTVNVMVGPGDDAHTYEPKPDQMMALSQSTLFFSIGVEYEDAWLPRFKDINPEMEIIDSAEGIVRIMETSPHTHENDNDNDHDEDDDQDHADAVGLDPHVWLSPANGKIIAYNIYTALAAASPADEAIITANYKALLADIDALDYQIRETLSGITQRNFMVYHPAWGYFAEEFGMTQLPIKVGGMDPSASELAALIDQALEEDIRVIFVQPQFSEANARAIAQEINGAVVQVDPLAYDWLANLERVADAFARALGN